MYEGPNQPLVSIITPAFNSAAFLSETVRSALEQTFSNFELLIVDDQSTDGTFELAREWMAADDRVRAWRVPHGGSAAARNAAMAEARGRYFALLDSDDVWTPLFLEEQVGILNDAEDISIVTANAINRNGAFDGLPIWDTAQTPATLRLIDIVVNEDAVCIMSVFRREVPDRIGGFDSRFATNEDYHFWLRAASAGFLIHQNPKPLGLYRRRPDSVSADEPRMLHGICAVLRDVAVTCALNPEERAAIENQLQRFDDELVMLDVRDCLDRRDASAAVDSLRTWAASRRNRWVGAVSNVAALWPQPIVWLYDLRKTLRSRLDSHA